MPLDKRLTKNIDWTLVVTVFLLGLYGLFMIYSTTFRDNPTDPFASVKRQAIAQALSVVACFFMLTIDYRQFAKAVKPIYVATILLLVIVFFLGTEVNGAKSWVKLGPLGRFQPSEFAKIGMIISLATVIDKKGNLNTIQSLIVPLALVGFPMCAILLQPDFGTAMVFVGILMGMFLISGVPYKYLAGLSLTGVIAFIGAYFFVFKDYQKDRLMSFLDPGRDPTGAGWNVIQARTAVGSGRLFGQGLLHGSQTQLKFVPENNTDFIFSAVGEELGFVGSIILLILFFMLIWRGIKIISEAKDDYGALIVAGVVSMFLTHILVNVGMNIGIMPVTGIPLSFVSFGGTSFLANSIGVALMLSVHMRRQKIVF